MSANPRQCRRVLVLLAAAAATLAARAQDTPSPTPLAIAGVQASALGGYGYLGVIQPFAGARLGEGWFHRTMASWLSYRYDATLGGAARRVHARAPGLDFGIGRAWSGPDGGIELSASVGLRHTRLRPDDPDSDVRGTQWAFTPQLIARHRFTPSLDGDLIASYSAGPNSRFVRARLGVQAGVGLAAGRRGAAVVGARLPAARRGAVRHARVRFRPGAGAQRRAAALARRARGAVRGDRGGEVALSAYWLGQSSIPFVLSLALAIPALPKAKRTGS